MKRVVVVALLAAGFPAAAEAQATIVVQGGAEVRPPPPTPIPTQRRYRRRPGPRLMPPLRIDIGGIAAGSDHGLITGAELSVGIHWASLSPEPTNFDIGLGAFGGAMIDSTLPKDAEQLSYGGFYGEFGKTMSGGDFWRTWASGRAEYFGSNAFGDQRQGLGASGKLEVELYLSGVGIAPNGIFLGTYAIGLYVEGGLRKLGGGTSIVQAGAGLTIRTPLVWEIW